MEADSALNSRVQMPSTNAVNSVVWCLLHQLSELANLVLGWSQRPRESTGCVIQNENPTKFKIVKKPLLIQKQTLQQQKAIWSLNDKGGALSWGRGNVIEDKKSKTLHAPVKNQQKMLFAVRRRGTLIIMPRPLSGCQIKAEIQTFLLM